MTVPNLAASAQFLRETEIRRGFELLYFGQSSLTRVADAELDAQKLGRAHYRALYFIARKPSLSVSELLRLLAITKQSLGRVLGDLAERGLVESRSDDRDARKRLLRLTAEGTALEARVYQLLRERLAKAYQAAGPEAVAGFWTVLESLIPDADRAMIRALGER
ncbi:MarR family winged helix-turn-helix transcriptional regulator [Sphingomonas sp. ac-8]|uniref:MarR family winged helix-turn-helix transcriptional regulator n=1 Tax=Sphingomonas sp. ac-8 TaxID=3242977 RepID=UPI003A80CE75